MESVGDYEYNTKDLIGQGAFAVVYKGKSKKVSHSPSNSRLSSDRIANVSNIFLVAEFNLDRCHQEHYQEESG